MDINVPGIMGESNPNEVLNTLTSRFNTLLPETVETEARKSKYDEAYDYFLFKYLQNLELNQVNPELKEAEYSSDEDVSAVLSNSL